MTGTVDSSTGRLLPVASDTQTTTNAANRDYAQPVYSALAASRPFQQVTNGFVGAPSDGLVQLDATHSLTALHTDAASGNLVQTVQVDLRRQANAFGGQANAFGGQGEFTLALGFGATQASAVAAATATLRKEFGNLRGSYEEGWQKYDESLIAPPRALRGVQPSLWNDLVDQYYLSANVVKASEDKTYPGALAASLASPWGQAISAGDPANTYFGSYREIFARDAYEAWTGATSSQQP